MGSNAKDHNDVTDKCRFKLEADEAWYDTNFPVGHRTHSAYRVPVSVLASKPKVGWK